LACTRYCWHHWFRMFDLTIRCLQQVLNDEVFWCAPTCPTPELVLESPEASENDVDASINLDPNVDVAALEADANSSDQSPYRKSRRGKRKAPSEEEDTISRPASSRARTGSMDLIPTEDADGTWWSPCGCRNLETGSKVSFTRLKDVQRHLKKGLAHTTADVDERTCVFCGDILGARSDCMRRHWRSNHCEEWRQKYNMPDTRELSDMKAKLKRERRTVKR
jgi:hypothetical protein